MAQVKFMDEIVDEYRRLFEDDERAPVLLHYVSNDMASNYYFKTRGSDNSYYVDQFTLQEYFNNDGDEYTYNADGTKQCKDHPGLSPIHVMDTCNTYEIESLENKAHALYELAQAT